MDSSNENLSRVLHIFRRVLQQPDSTRDSFLNQTCGTDASLRNQVELRLRRHRQLRDRDTSTLAASQSLATATDAFGQFETLEQIGAGTMGVVTKCRDSFGRIVAIKNLNQATLSSPEARSRFAIELKAIHALRHPGIVTVYSVQQTNGLPGLVMEYIDGGTLASRLAGGPKDPRWTATLVAELADAAHHAHDHGIVHRDLTPKNVLLTVDDRPKIADFGVAAVAREETRITATGALLGTPAYMAPEQIEGSTKEIDGRADVYALGVILYEALTGQLPFKGGVHEILNQVKTTDPVPLRLQWPAVPRDLETICLKCLEKEPDCRYRTAKELGDDLARWLDGRVVTARPVGILGRCARLARRYPGVAILATLSILLTCVTISILWVADNRRIARNREVQESIDDMLLDATRFTAEARYDDALARINVAREKVKALRDSPSRGRLDVLEAETRQRRADSHLTNELLEARLQQMGVPIRSDYSPLVSSIKGVSILSQTGGFSVESSQFAYDKAFRDYGIDFTQLSPFDAVRQIRQSKVEATIVEALEDWVWVAQNRDGSARVKCSTLIHVLDQLDPRAMTSELRAALRSPRPKVDLVRLAQSPDSRDFSVASLVNLAEALISEGCGDLAVTVAQAAYRREPANPFCLNVLAQSLRTQTSARREAAIGFYRGVLSKHPNSVATLINISQCLFECKRYEDALFEIRRVFTLKPNDQHALLICGLIHDQLGQSTQCTECLERAAAVDGPLTVIALEMLFESARQNRDWKRAQSYVERSAEAFLKMADNSVDFDWDALTKQIAEDFDNEHSLFAFLWPEIRTLQVDRMIALAERIAVRRPSDWESAFLLGRLFDSRKRYGEAAACFRKCTVIAPENKRPLANLANALYQVDEVGTAEKLAALRAVTDASPDPDLRHYVNYLRIGFLEWNAHNYEAAWREFEKGRRGAANAVDKDRHNQRAHYYLAAAAANLNRHEDAENALRQLKKIRNPDEAELLLECLAIQSKHREAINVLETHRQIIVMNTRRARWVVAACIENGDYENAIRVINTLPEGERHRLSDQLTFCHEYMVIRGEIERGEDFMGTTASSIRRRGLQHFRMGQYEQCERLLSQLKIDDLTELTCRAALVCYLRRAREAAVGEHAGKDSELVLAAISYLRNFVSRQRMIVTGSTPTEKRDAVVAVVPIVMDARIRDFRGLTGFAVRDPEVNRQLNAAWDEARTFMNDPYSTLANGGGEGNASDKGR